MALFRIRPADPSHRATLQAFETVIRWVERAQQALLTAIPTARNEGVPLAQALAEFGRNLSEAERALSAWSPPGSQAERQRCWEALAGARAEAERLRLEPRALGFEALNVRIGDVLAPLEDLDEVSRSLRRRASRGPQR